MIGRDTTVRVYIDTIRRTPLLSPDEEKKLSVRAHKGDHAAREQMIEANLRLVVSIAKSFQKRGMRMMELIEEGNLGLIRAVEHYDASTGNRFSTYAYECIKRAILKAVLEKTKVMRIPTHLIESVVKWKRIAAAMSQQSQSAMSWEHVARKMDFPAERLDVLKKALGTAFSTSRQVGTDTTSVTLADVVRDEAVKMPEDIVTERIKQERTQQIIDALRSLSEQEAEILRMHYGIEGCQPTSLGEIARGYGVSRQRICQIKKRAIGKLQKIAGDDDA